MKLSPASGSELWDQALTLRICALSASCLVCVAADLINRHLAHYIYPPKLRDHAPVALKRLNDLPWFMLLNKIDSYEMEMFSSFFFLICCRKDLSSRGDIFDPVLSCRGISEPPRAAEGEELSRAPVCSGISFSPRRSHTALLALGCSLTPCCQPGLGQPGTPRCCIPLQRTGGHRSPGELGAGRGLCASQGAGGPRAWGQGSCLFLVRVL